MCHLLQDMSVPAHVHCTSHAEAANMRYDFYENHIEDYDCPTAEELWNNGKEFINPYHPNTNYDDPIYFLMYFMNQIADHYTDGYKYGDDNYDANCPLLDDVIQNLEGPTTCDQYGFPGSQGELMNDYLMEYAIRTTAGLMLWFMSETKNLTTSGTISSNETWFGKHVLTGNITIPTGVTLTIEPGTQIIVPYSGDIEVEGTLIAEGTQKNPISFISSNSSWDGIIFDNSNNSILDFCTIKDASNGIWLESSSPSIKNTIIYSGINGIYLDNSNPTIENCYIHDNSYNGLYLVNSSSPILTYNTINNNGNCGIYCFNACEPQFGIYEVYSSTYGYNRIYDNDYGLDAEYNSNIIAGIFYDDMIPNCRYNSIFDNNTYDAYANDSDIIATWVYWGNSNYPPLSSQFYTTNGGMIERTLPLQNDPEGGSSLTKSAISNEENKFDPNNIDKNDPAQLYELAKYQRFIVDVNEALITLKDLVNRFPESKYAEKSLVQIFHISEKHKIKGLTSYFASLKVKKFTSNFQNTFENLQILKSVRDKEYNNAEKLCLDKLSKNLDTENEVFTLYQLVSLNHTKFDKKSQAINYLEIMKTKYSDNPLTISARLLMGEEVDLQQIQSLQKAVPEYQNENYVTKFHLAPAYPNPFNPSTTISFTLEKQSKVDIRIYNIQGMEVWNWGNNLEYGSGFHSINWNAMDATGNQLSTGIYFIKLAVGNQSATQKIIFMK